MPTSPPPNPRSSRRGAGGDGSGDEVEHGATAIIAPSGDGELAGWETRHRHALDSGPLVDAGVAGRRTPAHIDENIDAAAIDLHPDTLQQIDRALAGTAPAGAALL